MVAFVIPIVARAAAPAIARTLAGAASRRALAQALASNARSLAITARQRQMLNMLPLAGAALWLLTRPPQAGGYDFTGWTTLTECSGRGRNLMNGNITVTNCTLATTQLSNWNAGLNNFSQSQINNPDPPRRRVTVAMFESVAPVPDDPLFVNAVRAWRGRRDFLVSDYPSPMTYADLAPHIELPPIPPVFVPAVQAQVLVPPVSKTLPLHFIGRRYVPPLAIMPDLPALSAAQGRIADTLNPDVETYTPPSPAKPWRENEVLSRQITIVGHRGLLLQRLARGRHVLARPANGTKEKKTRVEKSVRALMDVLGVLDEAGQVVDALYEELPDAYKPRYVDQRDGTVTRWKKHDVNRLEKLQAIYDHFEHVNPSRAVLRLIQQRFTDAGIGLSGKLVNEAFAKVQLNRPFGASVAGKLNKALTGARYAAARKRNADRKAEREAKREARVNAHYERLEWGLHNVYGDATDKW